ncbi:MAG: DUF1634 domain-containing protein [Terriglobales bacterium]
MADKQTPETMDSQAEQNVYADVYRILLGGMIASSILFAIGLIRALLHPAYFPLTTEWVREHYRLSTVIHGLAAFDPTILMMVATVLLILTPVARVLVSMYAFWVDHDYKYVVVTAIVFLIMVLTVVLSHFGLQ